MRISVAPSSDTHPGWTLVFDDRCPVVQRLGRLVRQWDREGTFRFIGRDTTDRESLPLVQRLEATPWSLLLIGNAEDEYYSGPEAIPFILKNLPGGKLAAVTYTLPGTMWLTRQLYLFVSRNRHLFSNQTMSPASLK